MTLRELTMEVRKEKDIKPLKLSQKALAQIYVATIRVMVEELMTDPAHSFIEIIGFGKFNLIKHCCSIPFYVDRYNKKNGTNVSHFYTLQLAFNTTRRFRELINGYVPADTYKIARSHLLYPTEEQIVKMYAKKKKKRKYTKKKVVPTPTKVPKRVDVKRLPLED